MGVVKAPLPPNPSTGPTPPLPNPSAVQTARISTPNLIAAMVQSAASTSDSCRGDCEAQARANAAERSAWSWSRIRRPGRKASLT